MEYVDKLDTERDGFASSGGFGFKKHLKTNIRLAIKRAKDKGEYYNFVMVYPNDLYEFADSDYKIDGLKVISDYHTVTTGNFKLLK